MQSVFLSHNSNDKPFVRRLAKRLSASGLAVWLDEARLNIGDSILDKVCKAISEVEYVCVVISQNSIKSPWVKKEITLSVTREIEHSKPIVLPVLIDDCRLPVELEGKIFADFRKPNAFKKQCERLLTSMGIDYRQKARQNGLTVEWEADGPIISGHEVVLTSSESHSLMSRFIDALPVYIKQEKKRRGHDDVLDSATFLAVIKSCGDTYLRVPGEEEMQKGESELSRKMDLFYHFVIEMQTELLHGK